MPTLVTGATGLVGNNVLRQLIERGERVRVLVRSSSNPRPLAGLPVDIVEGDIRDEAAVRKALEGVSVVVHAAAYVHIGWSGLQEARAINVQGTRRVARAARVAGARMIHVSSVDAIGLGTRSRPADEESGLPGKVPCPYVITKGEAENVIHEEVDQGLDAVIVNPGFMVGPWDWKPSSGRMLLAVASLFTPLAPRGGTTLTDVREVAKGILAAIERGQRGRRYILAGHNMRYLAVWRLFARVTHKRGPWLVPGPIIPAVGGWIGDARHWWSGKEPPMNSASVGLSNQIHFYSSARAQAELGYQLGDPEEMTQAAWQWFLEHGYVQRA